MPRPKQTVIEYRSYELPLDFPILLLSGERWHISDIKSGRLHFHNCFEIGLCDSDSGIMEFYGEPRDFRAGDVTCIGRNVPHTTYSAPGEKSHWTYLFLDPQSLIGALIQDLLIGGRMLDRMLQDSHLILPGREYPQIHHLACAVIREMTQKKADYQLSVKGLCLSLLIEFLRVYSQQIKREEPKKGELTLPIAPALNYIHENYMYDFPMEHLAELCHLSPTHFRRIFHEIMQVSPLKFLHTTRVMESCILLCSTEDSIATVSEQVGYMSVSSYNRHFLEIIGHAPAQWRRAMLPIAKPSILEYTGWV